MEYPILGVFCLILLGCVALDISVIYALLAGLLLFAAYTRFRRYSWSELGKMLLSGIKTTSNILQILVLIGIMTALWRACGTIPVIICYASRLIRPGSLVLLSFLLNCLVSLLIGSALGTAATMGVICMSIGRSMGIDPLLLGGAIMSGIYFGDRCSPVSSCASLVADLTETDVFTNIRLMFRSALAPFCLCVVLYLLLGSSADAEGAAVDLYALFGREFELHWSALLPAAAIVVLSLFKIKVKLTMAVSIAISLPIALLLQHLDVAELPRLLLLGYSTADTELAAMLNGGGIRSMLRVLAIMIISSSYAGIFRTTGLLDKLKSALERLSTRISPFGGITVTAIVTSMLACNQTLSIILTRQMCDRIASDKQELAMSIADSAVVIAPLVPWSTAGGMPLATIDAPDTALLAAFYLYLLPLCTLAASLWRRYRRPKAAAKK